MASAFGRLGANLVRHSFRTRPAIKFRQSPSPPHFHTSVVRRAADEDDAKQNSRSTSEPAAAAEEAAAAPSRRAKGSSSAKSSRYQDADEVIDYGVVDSAPKDGFLEFPAEMSARQREAEKARFEEMLASPPEEFREEIAEYKRQVARIEQEMMREYEDHIEARLADEQERPRRFKPGVHAAGEDDPQEMGEDEPFRGNDITSLAHNDLEMHREIREYYRIAAWEMPLLHQYAKKFEPPGEDRPLRFRHTTYMGESHPAERKVVLEFCTADLPLTPAQRLKLIKLVGARYDPQKDLVHMSCEMFEAAAQNKRHLGDLVNTLLAEAKGESSADDEGAKDQFDDVAPDFRHVRWKKRLAFPDAWKMTPDRQASLDADRARRAQLEDARRRNGEVVSGQAAIEASLRKQAVLPQQQTNAKGRVGARLAR